MSIEKLKNKEKWAKDIAKYIIFERYEFKKLNDQILYLFNSRTVVIKNCKSPFETFSQH
jgi:hypothetical protein